MYPPEYTLETNYMEEFMASNSLFTSKCTGAIILLTIFSAGTLWLLLDFPQAFCWQNLPSEIS
jgi:hypothetical protein